MMSESRWGARNASGQHGMTLIEILVAVVVLSVGLLGLAGLQLKGMKVNQGSTYRWQAAMLAEDMADRIRADKDGAKAGNYSIAAFGAAAPNAGGAATIAAVNEWLQRVAALPSGQAKIIATPNGTANEITIAVQWDDSRGNAAATPGTSATVTVLDSYVLNTELYD